VPGDYSTDITRTIAYLEHCLATLHDAALPSDELEFLRTFLTHARGYLAKDVSAETEALDNWDTPENQAMIERFMTHVEERIRLIITEWQEIHADSANTALHLKMTGLLTQLDHLRLGKDAQKKAEQGGNGHS
jgi:hypothetical protein